MSTPTLDLWPSQFKPAPMTTPVALLRSQAALLPNKTDSLVEAFVISRKQGNDLLHQFYLRAPILDNYSYLLLTLVHPLHIYPVTLVAETTGKSYTAASPEQFVQQVGDILSAPETVKVIESLIVQSQQADS